MAGQPEGVQEYYTILDELKLKEAKTFKNGAVWLRYLV